MYEIAALVNSLAMTGKRICTLAMTWKPRGGIAAGASTLAMTGKRICTLAMTGEPGFTCHCEERSDEAISAMRKRQILYLFHV